MTERVLTLKHFFERAREGTLTGIRCRHCGSLAMPPKDSCEQCLQRAWDPVTLSGGGTIESFRVIAADAAYAVATVRLDEGVALLGRIVDIPLDKVAVGLAVRFRPLISRDQTSVGFGPA